MRQRMDSVILNVGELSVRPVIVLLRSESTRKKLRRKSNIDTIRLNTNVRLGNPVMNIRARARSPKAQPPWPLRVAIIHCPAPSSSSTLIKNSYILISRECAVPHNRHCYDLEFLPYA